MWHIHHSPSLALATRSWLLAAHSHLERRGRPTHEDIAGVAVAQRKAGVSNQVGQAVSAAQQALLGVPAAGAKQVHRAVATQIMGAATGPAVWLNAHPLRSSAHAR